jgi:hypothetical protein
VSSRKLGEQMAALEQADVEARLQDVESKGVTDTLYDMGKMLLDECSERVHYLDAKSVQLAGYTGAIIGLMVSTFPIWTSAVGRWAVVLVATGSLVGLAGGAMALASTWPSKFLLPSDTDWLEEDGFHDPERLKRYYISSLHIAISSHEQINASKVSKIKVAQACLGFLVLSLLVVLGNATYRTVRHPFQPSLGHAVSEGHSSVPQAAHHE